MATQVLSSTQQVPGTAPAATEDVPRAVSTTTSGTLSALDALTNDISSWAQDVLDRFFPPEHREALLAKIKAFVLANPKVSAFLGMNIALTGIPLGLFTLFGLSVAVCSVLGGIIVGLLGAIFFTLTCVGIGLVIVFPVVMFTTASACFLFLFGLGGYKILKWASGQDQDAKEYEGRQSGTTNGQSLNAFTGGRLTGLLDSAASDRDKQDIKGFSDGKTPPRQPASPQHGRKQTSIDTAKPETGNGTKLNAPLTPKSTSVINKPVQGTAISPNAQKRRADAAKAVMGDAGE